MRTATTLTRATALAAVTTLALAACGSSSEDEEAPSGSVNLRMTVWSSNEDQLALFDSIAEEYQADHPEIGSITFDSLPFGDYNTTLTTQIAGGNAPDLVWMGDIYNDLVAAGALAPLSEAFQATEGWGYDDLLPSLTAGYSQDDELYGYPFSNSPYALYVNTDLVQEAGQEYDPATLTWEQVSQIGGAVNEATGKGGFVIRDFDYSAWINLATVWHGWGADAWDENGQCTFDSPEMIGAFEFLHDAVYVENSMPGPGTTADFFAGDAAFTVAQVSRSSLLDGSFEYDIHPLPAGPAGDYAVQGQAGMGVLQAGDHVAEATDFLAFMTNPENSARLAQFFPPPRESLLTGEVLAELNANLSAEQLQEVVVEQLPNAVSLPSHANPAEIARQAQVVLDDMWTPQADVPAVLADVCTAIEPLLGQ